VLRRRESRTARTGEAFAWERFFEVGKWALLAYVATAGLSFPSCATGLSAGPLVVLTLSIAVYAIHVPVLIAFTVARYA
jgi:hypothetical protein